LVLLLAYGRGWVPLAIFLIFVSVLWVAFFKPTQCDVEKDNGEGCGNPARGRLRACHLIKHKRAKHDALWAMFGLKNPAIRYRVKWAQPRSSYGRVSPEPETPPPRLMRPVYDGAMLVATVLGMIATGTALVLQVHLV
jgi:hypothetical protein